MFVPAALVACALMFQGLAGETPCFDTFPSYAGRPPLPNVKLTLRMHGLDARSKGLARVLPVASPTASREVLALELKPVDAPADRPAILIVANLEGPQVFTSTLALWEAEQLVHRYNQDDPAVRELLDTTTLYFILRANPGAAEAAFRSPLMEQRASGHGIDNDRDGRLGEDAPSDVDGDGFVTMMRVPDPEGTWIEDPTDARAMVEADPLKGERGIWKLFPEGFDSDGDELVGEDPVADTELNHNFAQDWEEHTARGGLFAMDEPEARGLAEFMLAHDDIALVLCYGELDNLVEAPETAKEDAPAKLRIPAAGVIEPDAELLAELGKRYEELVEARFEGSGEDAGSFQAWTYHQRGLLTLSIRPWDIPLDAEKPEPETPGAEDDTDTGEASEVESGAEESLVESPSDKPSKTDDPKPSDDAKRLIWIDANAAGEESKFGTLIRPRFQAWTSVEHPQFGPVEIGGFYPYARTEPSPLEDLDGALHEAQLAFLLTLGADLPRVALADCTATELGEGLVEVEAFVEITGRLPLQTAAARKARTVRPARVTLVLPDGAEIVAGKRIEFVSQLGVGERARFRWLVLTPAGSEIGVTVDTDNAGSARIKAEVK